MTVQNNFLFFDEQNTVANSNELVNIASDLLTVQVAAETGKAFALEVQGKTDINMDFESLLGVTVSDVTGSISEVSEISANGIYAFDIAGISVIRVSITSVDEGADLRVFGRCTG